MLGKELAMALGAVEAASKNTAAALTQRCNQARDAAAQARPPPRGCRDAREAAAGRVGRLQPLLGCSGASGEWGGAGL